MSVVANIKKNLSKETQRTPVTFTITAEVVGFKCENETPDAAKARLALEVEHRINRACDIRAHVALTS